MNTAAEVIQTEQPVKLTIERSILLKSLGRLQSVVERRNTLPILSNIKLETTDKGLQLTATDMDLVATEIIPADITSGGALTVPAQTLYDIIRKLPDGSQISLDTDSQTTQLIVEAGAARFTLSYLPAREFPVMSEGEMTHHFSLDSNTILNLLEKCRFAMSTEETRYYLNGVFFHTDEAKSDNPRLKAVATDGHRLARVETSLPAGANGMPKVIIPRKTVNELRKLFDEQGDQVNISVSESKIRFASGNVVLLSKLVDGTFPDYELVIPDNNTKIMEVNAALFTQAVDRVSTIITEKARGIKLSIAPGKVTLLAQSPDSGTAKEEIEANYSADPLEIGFNARYMLDMMAQLEGETVQFLLSDANAPALVTDPNDVTALYVIMPRRV